MTRRILVSYFALTGFVLVVLGAPLGVSIARGERAELVARVERDAAVLASVVEDSLEHGAAIDYRQVASWYADRTTARAVIVDADGVTVGDSDAPVVPRRDFSTRPEIAEALAGRIATGYRYSDTLGTRLLYVAMPVASGGQVHGAVRLTYPTAAVDARIRRGWLTLAGVSAVALAAAAVVGAATARWVSRPLRDLHGTAQRLAAGDLAARASDGSGPPEIRALARTLDQMSARLDALLTSQKTFVADASHQLRSPLTALRLRLEGITNLGPDEQDRINAAVEEVARLSRLVNGLLTLARAEGSPPTLKAIDVAAVIRERVDAWEALVTESAVTLVIDVHEATAALAAPGALEQILDNYLANALAVAPPGSTIAVRSHVDGDHVVIEVADDGPGLTAEQSKRAFDRFWRGPHRDQDGFGLGLPIVARLATASGGQAQLRPTPSGGMIASITLPSSSQPTPASTAPTGGVSRF